MGPAAPVLKYFYFIFKLFCNKGKELKNLDVPRGILADSSLT